MSCLDLTAGLVILLFLFKCLDLALCEYQTLFGHFFFKCPQPILETTQSMSQPDTANTAGRNENTSFPQFVTGSDLAVGRLFNSIFDHSSFSLLINPIFQIGLATVFADQGINAAFVNGCF